MPMEMGKTATRTPSTKMVIITCLLALLVTAPTLQATECGKKTPKPSGAEPLIIGGKVVNSTEYPFMASLRLPYGYKRNGKDSSGMHFCGGTLIDPFVVLTAAHCVYKKALRDPEVHFGRKESEGLIVPRFPLKAKKTIIHPRFKVSRAKAPDFDIALLVFDKPANRTDFDFPIDVIDMADSEACFVEGCDVKNVTTVGFGETGDKGKRVSVELRGVELPIVTRKRCKKLLGADRVTSSMICAGEEGKDACWGDSGSALLLNCKVVGVTSWGTRCGEKNLAGVWASVPAVRKWIDCELRKTRKPQNERKPCSDEGSPRGPEVVGPRTPSPPPLLAPGTAVLKRDCFFINGRLVGSGC